MGKITNALKRAAEDRIQRIDKINRIKEQDKLVIKKMGSSKVDSRIVSYFDPKALITEQYKILRTNFLSINKNNPPRTMVLTSSLHSEGKTITSLNFAIVMSQTTNKPRIITIDADMRRGRMSKYLGIEQECGLSDLLNGKATLDQAVFNIDIENLTFMASGPIPHNPAELLASESMKNLMNELRQRFDYIIFDTPPIIAVTDAGILAAMADATLLVVQAGRTQRGIVRRATELLDQAHANVIGHVLTNIEYHLPEYIYRYL